MNSLQITSSGPSLMKSQLAAFEKKIGVRLPEDYQQFLLKHNGGRAASARNSTATPIGSAGSTCLRGFPLQRLLLPLLAQTPCCEPGRLAYGPEYVLLAKTER